MVMEESAMHHHHQPHSPSGGDTPNSNSNTTNVYLVGLEFVRQYYTVLNQGPLYLHRFYSDDSSFVHGVSARDSKVAYGQQEIHKRIQSLNFHNCHAKIRQVDSHETLGNGVVIQVTGELSNNGQPMRRFMQTFVLAPQTPKRYYVRNDIFHYQDEVFCDDENDGETAVESGLDTEETEENERDSGVEVNLNGEIPIEPTPPISAPVEVSAKLSPTSMSRPAPKVDEEEEEEEEEKIKPEPVPVNIRVGPSVESVVIAATVVPVNSAPVEEEPVVNNTSAPKTYANLFKNSGFNNKATPPKFQSAPTNQTSGAPGAKGANGPTSGTSPSNSQFSVNTGDARTTSPSQVSPQPTSASAVKGLPPRNPRGPGYGRDRGGENNRPPMDRDVKERRERLTSRSSTTLNDETGSIDGDRRRPVHTYPDANQLFVGNLPHFVTVQDMKDIFSEFGEVAEVKIQKPTPKSGGMKVPYFCFVVFEDAASAQNAIDRKGEIFMKMTGGGNRRLNVEQKRSQRSGRPEGDHSDAPYNRMDTASPGGGGGGGGSGRQSEGNRNNSRTFRGSNRGGDQDRRGGDQDRRGGDQDRRGGDRNDRDRGGHMGGGRGGGMNQGRGGGGGGGGMGSGRGQGSGNKP